MKAIIFCLVMLVCCRSEDKMSSDHRESADAGQAKKTGEEYLRKVMSRLQSERSEGHPVELPELMDLPQNEDGTTEAMRGNAGPQQPGSILLQAEIVADPEIHHGLTAEELKAIYNYAATKLANLSLSQASIKPISNFHHPPPPPAAPTENLVMKPVTHGSAAGILPGYYYYYYPIKSFVGTTIEPKPASPPTFHDMAKPVQMQATITMTDASDKSVEPLFMAISGFIGMALMFIISVLFVPKFGKLRSGELNPPNARHDLLVLGRLVFDSLDGKDCEERLACEIGRILRGAKMDNKPLRVLEIILPPKFSNQISMIRKTAAKREKCISIPCKLRKPEAPKTEKEKKKTRRKPWKKAQSKHDLWMRQFENRTKFHQPENIWERNQPKNP